MHRFKIVINENEMKNRSVNRDETMKWTQTQIGLNRLDFMVIILRSNAMVMVTKKPSRLTTVASFSTIYANFTRPADNRSIDNVSNDTFDRA